ncbi:MAG: molybdate ABC transporter substrate-binding protein [Actinobacteria bacterium]|nr:molybdate ABC transporter substrate-binding protein [Actinomycetota bacterium]MCB9411735.1 molybdate ABC transporter substrate-binding protein [Actinomycetota bacterium]
MTSRALVALLAVVVALLGGCAADDQSSPTTGAVDQTVVRVAAASDLRFALAEVTERFTAERPGIEVATSYGSSGTFYQQLRNGAPFDVFLSADVAYPERLAAAGLADPGEVFDYAIGQLVIWAPNGSPVDPDRGLAGLGDEAATTIAIANPAHAPYGAAAVAALKSAGVYDRVAPRLVLGENAAQAAEFVQSGNADAGLIALSLALSPAMSTTGTFAPVPPESFPTLRQGGVILDSDGDSSANRAFRDFLLGPVGRAILAEYGFSLPEG